MYLSYWNAIEIRPGKRPAWSIGLMWIGPQNLWATHVNPSSETQGQSVGSGEKARWWKFLGTGGKAPGYRLSPDHFQTVNAGSCNIVPYRRTASHEFLSCVRTRLLLSRHTILYLSGSFTKVVRARGTLIFYFTNQKRTNYRYIQIWNRQGMLKGKIALRRSKTSLRCWAASLWWRGWSRRKQTLGWFSNRTGTPVDDGARKSNNRLDQWHSCKWGTGSRV